jgi:hypothetical protein
MYAKRYYEGTNLVLLDPGVRKAFHSERAVNEALCLVIVFGEGEAKSARSEARMARATPRESGHQRLSLVGASLRFPVVS